MYTVEIIITNDADEDITIYDECEDQEAVRDSLREIGEDFEQGKLLFTSDRTDEDVTENMREILWPIQSS